MDFIFFMCFFFIFDTKQVKNDKKTNKHSKLLNNKNSKNILECKNKQKPTMSHHIERINACTCYNTYA